ncbi:MAG: Peptidoglycan D,D-transpeptidase FtsI [Stenotrophomonas maltophilia]|uniref:Peptidoglycan D,D-transpeptidase FtsI n=1 Tax=Stenotrophomonas maltophilia TaxID=40324 RepID=A0A7V8JMT5_STEMA|nr:MAG: Peptidoglycan D,D-transpeptidase FtsI [Stenotrophomonas maltophilia]
MPFLKQFRPHGARRPAQRTAGSRYDVRIRFRLVCAAMAMMGVALVLRAADVQVINRGFYMKEAEARMLHRRSLRAHRGTLYDRNGVVIAGSAPVASLWLDPREFNEAGGTPQALAAATSIDVQQLAALLRRHRHRRFVYLPGYRRRDPDQLARVAAAAPAGVHSRQEFRRFYPQAEHFAQLVGTTNIEGKGQEGLELVMEARLAGHPGHQEVIADRLGRAVELHGAGQPAVPGEDIHLTVDARMQYAIYTGLQAAMDEFGAAAASVVVLEIGSDEVIAMVNWPSYNNNRPTEGNSGVRRNRAVTDVFEPGSTVKPFTVSAALDAGVVTPSTVFDTSPGWIQNGCFVTRD